MADSDDRDETEGGEKGTKTENKAVLHNRNITYGLFPKQTLMRKNISRTVRVVTFTVYNFH